MLAVEIVISLFLFFGSLLIMFGALGVIRFADPLCRSHALGKASSLGICLVLGGLWMALDDEIAGLKILLVMVFSLVTIPMASHLIALYVYNIQGTEVTLRPGKPAGDRRTDGLSDKAAPDAESGNAR